MDPVYPCPARGARQTLFHFADERSDHPQRPPPLASPLSSSPPALGGVELGLRGYSQINARLPTRPRGTHTLPHLRSPPSSAAAAETQSRGRAAIKSKNNVVLVAAPSQAKFFASVPPFFLTPFNEQMHYRRILLGRPLFSLESKHPTCPYGHS